MRVNDLCVRICGTGEVPMYAISRKGTADAEPERQSSRPALPYTNLTGKATVLMIRHEDTIYRYEHSV